MANLTESPVYESGIFQLERSTPAVGGAPVIDGGIPSAGHANAQALQLANRTAWLKQQIENGGSASSLALSLADKSDAMKGATLVGYDDTNLGEQLNQGRKLANYTALRNYSGSASRAEITQSGFSGFFNKRPIVDGDVEIYGLKFVSADGLGVWERDFVGNMEASWLGANPTTSAAVNTVAIQAGINFMHSLGGGVVNLSRGKYQVSVTAETDIVIRDTVLAPITGCIVLRSGVTLDLTDSVIIECKDSTRDIVNCLDMDGGGVRGGWIKNVFNESGLLSGAGSGILFNISTLFNDNINLTFDGTRISNVGSYGIGAQYGDYHNNRYTNLYIHDTGADAIDHKVRYGSNNTSRGVSFENIVTQRHGRRPGITGSAGLDIRGPAHLNNIFVLDYANQGFLNAGIRFSAATGMQQANAYEVRESSSYSSLVNFYLDSGDLSVTDSQGLVFLSSEGTHASNGDILNCGNQGFLAINTSAGGWGTCKNSTLTDVTVNGAIKEAFSVRSERVTLIGCSSAGARTTFEAVRGNLVAGQTQFVVQRGYIASSVVVQKNGVTLTNGTDFTATNSKIITLAVGVVASDSLVVLMPTAIGYRVTETNATLVACRAQDTTVLTSVAGVALPSFQEIGSDMGQNSIRTVNAAGTPYLEPFTTATDLDLELRSKGSGAVALRSGGLRALLASSPSSAVNWLSVLGSVTGQAVRIQAQGSDANINLSLGPKGTGILQIPLANVPQYSSDSAASTGGVPVGGIYRNGSALQIRIA